MKLWHFTSIHHLRLIVKAGVLDVTESNIGSADPALVPFGERVGPDVVWCFDTPAPMPYPDSMMIAKRIDEHGQTLSVDKRLVRITIDVPKADAVRWVPWAKEQGINPRWLKMLTAGHQPKEWWVVLRPVPDDEWLIVEWRQAVGEPWELAAVRDQP